MKNIWIIANWKSNKTINEALEWIAKVGPRLPKYAPPAGGLKMVVCPTFSAIPQVRQAIIEAAFPLMVGSQDISPFGIGPFTGEEPAEILKQFIDLSIIGHSERRQNFFETDEIVAMKTKKALESQIIPLVCVQGADAPIPTGCNLIAYEPVFAIGTGHPDTPENANKVAQKIKQNREIEVLYGGSIKSGNIKNFISQPDISGVLVGKSFLDPEEFIKSVEEVLIEAA